MEQEEKRQALARLEESKASLQDLSRQVPVKKEEGEEEIPKIYSLFEKTVRQGRQQRLNRERDSLHKQHQKTLASAKAIFSIALTCLQHLH